MTEQKKDIDQISGVETTGHEWDGLKELNNPTPRWWLWVFFVTIVWSVGYWVVYPAWPTLEGNTKGAFHWTQFEKLKQEQDEITLRQSHYFEKFNSADFSQIMNDPELYAFASAGGAAAFKNNCATCHGTGAAGGKGYPNLNDDDWLWGGKVEDIYQTLLYGIRSPHEDTRTSMMPAFGKDGLLTSDQISTMVNYVTKLSSQEDLTSHPGYTIFQNKCSSCHGPDAKGGREFGAPNLADDIWLYGSDKTALRKTIYYGRSGVMPYWKGRLDDATLRQLTVYIHSLGGGEESNPISEPVNTSPAGSDAPSQQ